MRYALVLIIIFAIAALMILRYMRQQTKNRIINQQERRWERHQQLIDPLKQKPKNAEPSTDEAWKA